MINELQEIKFLKKETITAISDYRIIMKDSNSETVELARLQLEYEIGDVLSDTFSYFESIFKLKSSYFNIEYTVILLINTFEIQVN